MSVSILRESRNGNSNCPEKIGIVLQGSRGGLGDQPAHVGSLGTGAQPAPRACPDEAKGNHRGGTTLAQSTGEPAFSALFDNLLADQEAEREYQTWLAELTAEFHEHREEDGAYWAAHHRAAAASYGEEVSV